MDVQLSDHRPVFMSIDFKSADKINLLSQTDSIDNIEEANSSVFKALSSLIPG